MTEISFDAKCMYGTRYDCVSSAKYQVSVCTRMFVCYLRVGLREVDGLSSRNVRLLLTSPRSTLRSSHRRKVFDERFQLLLFVFFFFFFLERQRSSLSILLPTKQPRECTFGTIMFDIANKAKKEKY